MSIYAWEIRFRNQVVSDVKRVNSLAGSGNSEGRVFLIEHS